MSPVVINETERLIGFLKNVKLFAELSTDSLLKLGSCLKTAEFPPAEVIVREGAPGVSMYIIKSGLVEVRKKDTTTGFDFLVAQLSKGAAVGEMSLLTGKPRSATVTTVQPSVVFTLTRADFRSLLTQRPEISLGLARILAERLEDATKQVGIEYVNLFKRKFDRRIVGLVPQSVCLLHKVVPIAYVNNTVTLAMVNPSNLVAFDDVRRYIKGVVIEPQVCTEDDFKRFMDTVYPDLMGVKEAGRKKEEDRARNEKKRPFRAFQMQSLEDLQNEILSGLEVQQEEEEKTDTTDLATASEDAPIIRLANNILALAIKKGASDIHIEPQEKEVAVRFRIDGKLQYVEWVPKKIQMGLISRFKILSKLDIAEKRLPQDGRISVRMEDRPIDFRVSTIPSKWGEKICMRILDKSNTLLGLDKLILHQEPLGLVRDMIAQPYGIIYVTGPTGSGRTTTLYSALVELNDPDVNVSTAEDPIEYDLPRVNQVQTHKEIGLDFARVLRAFLRQDPDIILVGETRDTETAKIAVEAALTGHLVLTTLHTNDAAGAFTRLGDMGIEPFLMSSSTIGVIAQRLTRRLCQECKEPYTPDDITLKYMNLQPDPTITFYRHKGCERCSFTGYRGRVGVYEVLRMNAQVRRLVAQGATPEAVAEAAVQTAGMKTLKDYSLWLLKNGWTTMDEILQVVSVRE